MGWECRWEIAHFFVGKVEGKRRLARLGRMFNWVLKNMLGECGLNFSDSNRDH
jgi:hypothetical protein